MTAWERLLEEPTLRPLGSPCRICGNDPEQRHRLWDAMTDRWMAGEPLADIGTDYDATTDDVAAVMVAQAEWLLAQERHKVKQRNKQRWIERDTDTRQVTFAVPGRPIPQGSLASFRHKTTGAVVTPQKARVREYRDRIAWAAKATGMACTDEPVRVRAVFGFARPKSHRLKSGKLTKRAPQAHAGRPDVDKLARALLDAITGVLVVDDSQVVALDVHKQWHDLDETWVQVTPWDGPR